MTANCASPVATRGKGGGNKYGVAASPKVIPDGMPIPKGGGRDMVGKPYVVGERTYIPHAGKGYVREGEASWYGTAFHGRLTANGEIFDKESVAAAHPTLPLPSYVRVTNLANRRSMIVRVNDRGPYERGRVIDLSERAAQALEFHRAGTSKVRVEYVGRAALGGSDDRKLLATLRTDDTPAAGTRRGPVMLASLDEARSDPRPSSLAFKPDPKPDPKPLPSVESDETGEGLREANPAAIVVAARATQPSRLQEEPEPVAQRLPPVQARFAGPVGRETMDRPTTLVASRVLPKSDKAAERLPVVGAKSDRLADRLAVKSDRMDVNPERLAPGRPQGGRLPARLDGSLDLATIPSAARPTPPLVPQRPATLGASRLSDPTSSDLARKPARPGLQVAETERAGSRKADRKRLVNAETGPERNTIR